jgi:hypothetical protein
MPRSGAWVVTLWLVACASPSGTREDAGVYGADDRIDVHAEPSTVR